LPTHLRDKLGVARGDRVAVPGAEHDDTLEVQFACGRIGAVFLPLNTRLNVPELQFIVGDAAPKVMIHDTDLAEVALAVAKLCRRRVPRCGSAPVDPMRRRSQAHSRSTRFEDVTLDDISTIMYTSGTTGQPKGAIITHGMTFWNCVNLGGPAYISPSSVLLTVLPLFPYRRAQLLHQPGAARGRHGADHARVRSRPGAAADQRSRARHQPVFGVPSIYQFMAPTSGLRHLRLQPAGDWRCRRRADAGAAPEGVGGARRRAANKATA
jgi:fatty-acyl-CoA synthase